MVKHYCDLCNSEIKVPHSNAELTINIDFKINPDQNINRGYNDTCQKCRQKIFDFIKDLKFELKDTTS